MESTCRNLIVREAGIADMPRAADLFREYASGLDDVDLAYQGFENELASLPGAYAPPHGTLLLAEIDGEPVGCVALRPLPETEFCEMKRLYVRDRARGTGAGRALAEAVIAEAIRLRYAAMRLDTLLPMKAALSLYRALGFREIAAYYSTPIAGTVFMEKKLAPLNGG
jgi:ribosomal protein S18 acetylase RimI-like enzyme